MVKTIKQSANSSIDLDQEQREEVTFQCLKVELKRAFSAPNSSYKPLTAKDIFARNRAT